MERFDIQIAYKTVFRDVNDSDSDNKFNNLIYFDAKSAFKYQDQFFLRSCSHWLACRSMRQYSQRKKTLANDKLCRMVTFNVLLLSYPVRIDAIFKILAYIWCSCICVCLLAFFFEYLAIFALQTTNKFSFDVFISIAIFHSLSFLLSLCFRRNCWCKNNKPLQAHRIGLCRAKTIFELYFNFKFSPLSNSLISSRFVRLARRLFDAEHGLLRLFECFLNRFEICAR